ncbi:MAG: UxaA family hydrolase [Firmicutes bacterium]|nr:UxaA family hydrolase [Bacillota bacterium]
MEPAIQSFHGFWRSDGRVGTRNHVLILPLAPAVNRAASLARDAVSGSVGVEMHQDIGPDVEGYEFAMRVLAGWADHPNVYATIFVAVSETDPVVDSLLHRLSSKTRYHLITLQKAGGTRRAADQITQAAKQYLAEAQDLKRQPAPLEKLILATECGGSDACSGLSANPSLGHASDLVIRAGGTSILAETTGLIGAEKILADRAIKPSVGEQLFQTVYHAEHASMRMGVDMRGAQPAPGNIEGGITTIEEKSLGCVHKGGNSPLVDVIDYAERPRSHGLVVMDTPGHDVMQLVGMAAAGAQVIVFTTGRGTPTGSAIVPVIKMSTRTALKQDLSELIDIDAGPVVDGYLTVAEIGWQLFRKIIAVANGERVSAERLGHREFGIFQGWGGQEA